MNLLRTFLQKYKEKPAKYTALFLFLIVFTVYLITCAQYHMSYADSDELTLMGYTLGVAHQPGYPLYILILFVFTHIIPFGSIAFRANSTSVLFESAAIVMFYFTSLEILQNIKIRGREEKIKKKRYKIIYYRYQDFRRDALKISIAFLSSLILAFSSVIWIYGTVAEVFAMNNFIAISILYLTLYLTRICFTSRFPLAPEYTNQEEIEKRELELSKEEEQVMIKKIQKILVLLVILLGIGLSHLQTIALIYPFVFFYVLILLLRTKYLKSMFTFTYTFVPILVVLFVFFFLAPFTLLIYYNSLHNSVSWSFMPTIQGIWQDISRQNYVSTATGNAYSTGVTASSSFAVIPAYFSLLFEYFNAVPILLGIIGFIYLFIKNKRLWLYFTLLYASAGIGIAMYLGFLFDKTNLADYYGNIATIERQYIIGDIIFALFIPVGLFTLYKLCIVLLERFIIKEQEKSSINLFVLHIPLLLTLVIGIIGGGYQLISNFAQSDLQSVWQIDQYDRNTLTQLKKNGILTCYEDETCFSLLYTQIVEKVRPDIIIVPISFELRQNYFNTLKNFQKFYYKTRPENMGDVISWNLHEGKHVYFADVNQAYWDYLGINKRTYFVIPNGNSLEITKYLPSSVPLFTYSEIRSYVQNFQKLDKNDAFIRNHWGKEMEGILTTTIINNGFAYFEDGYSRFDYIHTFKTAADLLPQSSQYTSYFDKIKNYSGDTTFHPKAIVPSSDQFFNTALTYKDTNPTKAGSFLLQSILEDPTNTQSHLFLAYLYARSGQISNARKEYENVLILDKNNSDAQNALIEIKNYK